MAGAQVFDGGFNFCVLLLAAGRFLYLMYCHDHRNVMSGYFMSSGFALYSVTSSCVMLPSDVHNEYCHKTLSGRVPSGCIRSARCPIRSCFMVE